MSDEEKQALLEFCRAVKFALENLEHDMHKDTYGFEPNSDILLVNDLLYKLEKLWEE